MPGYKELNEIIAGSTDQVRTVESISVACAAKAEQMVDDGHLDVMPECLKSGCVTAHVARIHLQRGEISQHIYGQLISGVSRIDGCLHEECVCHPSFDKAHQPNADKVCPMEDSHYLPSPMAG